MIQVGVVYKIINNINQKLYIGQTTNFEDRIKQHKKARSEYSLLHKSIRYHKWHNFSVIKLHENVPFKDLEWLEKYCISIYDSMAPNGYNLKYGGDRGLTSEETKRKQSEALKGEKNKNYKKDLRYQKDRIIEKYLSGMSIKNIANEYKCGIVVIKNILLENGFESRPIKRKNIKTRKSIQPKDKKIKRSKTIRNSEKSDVWNHEKEIIEKYLSGLSLVAISKEYKCSHNLIRNILIANNIDRRDRNEYKQNTGVAQR